ncbi:hypothetical protein Efla_004018 [Eimeria flavescens]
MANSAKPLLRRSQCAASSKDGHEAIACPQKSNAECSYCGHGGHHAEECPLYLMDLSIRGSLTAYVEERKQQAAVTAAKAADRGRFPAMHSDAELKVKGKVTDTLSSKNEALRSNEAPSSFSAVECVVCGKLGHANCEAFPLSSGAIYCPRCAHVGHTAMQCRIWARNGFGRPSLLEQLQADSSDFWKEASQSGRSTNAPSTSDLPAGRRKPKSKPESIWRARRKATVAKAAAADPWHPSHLR